jgi:hypothetical protein
MYSSVFKLWNLKPKFLVKNSKMVGRLESVRQATTSTSGAVLPMPPRTRFGLLGLVAAVVPGLLIGATISKRIANFLEENELFVPSDDDDDDD